MMEFLVGDIIDFIKDEFSKEDKLNSKLLEHFKTAFADYTKLNKKGSKFFNKELFEMNLETFSTFVKEVKEIRQVYQKGKVFVNNQTKGSKKGFNFRWHQFLEWKVRDGKIEEAKKEAIDHLDKIKKWYSERTYYRHLKKIRELGIEV